MKDLIEAALEAQKHAYAPYSKYHVGAAVLGDNGKIYAGANVENASYGLSICAERSAITKAIFDGVKTLKGVAVVTQSSPPAAPCGMCRQTIAEFAHEVDIVCLGPNGERFDTKISELLPRAFRPEALLP